MVKILIYTFIYCFSFFSLEVLKRKQILSSDSTRRIIHIGAAIIAYTFPFYLSLQQVLIICFILLGIMIFSRYKSLLSHIHKVDRKTWGEIFYPLGIMIAAISFLPNDIASFRIVILILGVSDLLANIIGTHLGSHSFEVFKCKKTIEGSFAFFVSTLIILLIFQINPLVAVFISMIATFAEFFSPYGSDNLIVPIIVSVLLILF
jgi:dolichol kinase